MNQAQALYHLQAIDLTISERQSRLASVERALGDDKPVIAAEQALQQAEKTLAPWRQRVRDLELEIKSLVEKATAAERQLYSGSISNPKVLQDRQDELASLKRRRAKLEDDLLEAMIEVENAQAALGEAQENLEQVRSAWEKDQSDLAREQQSLREALEELKAQREAALQHVSPESLAAYDSLRASKRGQAVAQLTGNACKSCGVSQTTATIQQVRQGRELIFCSNCGRILVLL